MAGHSKWANIKHRKAKVDAQRGKAWSKAARAIMVAAKHGGDPDANFTLRYAVEEAKAANMPKDTIERAIKKGAGELGADTYEHVRYEGYGPGGAAIIADALTDNRTRTAPEMRLIFSKFSGNLGATGCVSYMFDHRGVITVDAAKAPGEDRLIEVALEAGADDATLEGEAWSIVTKPTALLEVRAAIEAAGVPVAAAELRLEPQTLVTLRGGEAKSVVHLIEALEEHEDVQKVYTNADIPEDVLAAMD
jgi:YebC/PmpR family DNA-binding regulatory protein